MIDRNETTPTGSITQLTSIASRYSIIWLKGTKQNCSQSTKRSIA